MGRWNPKNGEYEPVLTREEGTNDITINFIQVPPEEFREDIFSNATMAGENNSSRKTTDQNSKEKKNPSLVYPRIMTLQISISKGV